MIIARNRPKGAIIMSRSSNFAFRALAALGLLVASSRGGWATTPGQVGYVSGGNFGHGAMRNRIEATVRQRLLSNQARTDLHSWSALEQQGLKPTLRSIDLNWAPALRGDVSAVATYSAHDPSGRQQIFQQSMRFDHSLKLVQATPASLTAVTDGQGVGGLGGMPVPDHRPGGLGGMPVPAVPDHRPGGLGGMPVPAVPDKP
jgi:hypothetical protein